MTKKSKHQESITVKNVTRIAILTPLEGEPGFSVECPSLPGCTAHGSTRDEAVTSMTEAIKLHIEVLKANDQPVPEENREIAYLRID
jgi:predicted RNase H-like HicB family nuclease